MNSGSKNSSIKRQISENLKRVYDEALEDDVPDSFAKLVERFQAEKEKVDRAKSHDN